MAALLDLFNELEKMRRARASSSLSSIALIVGCYSMIHFQWAWPIEHCWAQLFERKKEPCFAHSYLEVPSNYKHKPCA